MISLEKTQEQVILSVTEISLALKSCVEQVFAHIRIRGEISGLKKATSGHIYFSLKDADSVLSAVCWRGRNEKTVSSLQEGLEVICTGKLSTYPGRSNYQMIVETVEPAGEGALLKLLKERKEKLEREGLFNPLSKKKIPYLPKLIGVITSPTGAVIQDIIHRLRDRCPTPVLVWPVLVQGEGASEQITKAIQGFNSIPESGVVTEQGRIYRPDVLIVARGGGSLEDLWCFNEENVVRATAASCIPIISAVGHETDTTLIDYASDIRAPTPTGAAEMAVPVRHELLLTLEEQKNRLNDGIYRCWDESNVKLTSLGRSLPNLSEVVENLIQKWDDRADRLEQAFSVYMRLVQNKLDLTSKLLKSYSYHAILERGFTLVSNTTGGIIGESKIAQNEQKLQITFFDGSIHVIPMKNEKMPKKKKILALQEQDEQPDLFT